jgi:hypothetical protein
MRSVPELVSLCISSSGSPILASWYVFTVLRSAPTLARSASRLAIRLAPRITMAPPALVSVHKKLSITALEDLRNRKKLSLTQILCFLNGCL